MVAGLCPVCNNQGKDPPGGNFSNYYVTPCHGCYGKGWIQDDTIELELAWRTQTIYLDKCLACGGDTGSPALTGCPSWSHCGSSCVA